MSDSPFGLGSFSVIGIYLVVMIGLAVAARRVQGQRSLGEFYLANRSLGPLVLLLTLYATQYSGNSLLGVPGEAHRVGYVWVLSVGFMMSVVVAYLLFAPQLHRSARRHGFVTPSDWIDHRFGAPALSFLVSLLYLVVLMNFLLAQLLAMGHVVVTLSGQALPFWAGVVGLGLVIVLYETLGGLRGVAWTDCAQAVLILLGLAGILFAVLPGSEGLGAASAWIIEHAPSKAAVPEGPAITGWFSTLLLVSFSAAVYPQAIQRLFAARSQQALARSLSVMVFMPFVTVLPMFLVGILSIPLLPAVQGIAADQVMPELLRIWAGGSLWLHAMAVLVLTGTIAAIMSTADSVLLSLSSILAKDILGKTWLKGASSVRLTRLGKALSWLVMLGLVTFALSPRISLWGLIELKLEVLIQIAPAIILGTLWPGMTARGALAGLLVGTLIAGGLTLGGVGKLWGWHAGVLGVAANLAVACLTSLAQQRSMRTAQP